MKINLILNNIRSSENVGSIFRTSDAAGVSKIFLSGYTPAPIDKFGRKNKALMKASLGAEESVSWEKVKNFNTAIKKLNPTSLKLRGTSKERFKIVAVEQDTKSINYKKLASSGLRLAFVFGNEVTGLSKKELSLCDAIVEIPMKGKNESLNVSVSAGVVLFSLV